MALKPKHDTYQNVVNGADFGNMPEPSGKPISKISLLWLLLAPDPPAPDLRTPEQKRADYLKSCHVNYTK